MAGKRENIERKVSDISNRISKYKSAKKSIQENLQNLYSKYKRGEITYRAYQEALKDLLKGKSLEDWQDYYDKQISLYESYIDFYKFKVDRIKILEVKKKNYILPLAIFFLLASIVLIILAFNSGEFISLAPELFFYENCNDMSEWGGVWSVANLMGDNICSVNLDNCETGCTNDMTRTVISDTEFTSAFLNLTYGIANAPTTSSIVLYVSNGIEEVELATLPGNGANNVRVKRVLNIGSVIALTNQIDFRFSCQGVSNGGLCIVDDVILATEEIGLQVDVQSPRNVTYGVDDMPLTFRLFLSNQGQNVAYSFDGGITNISMDTLDNFEYTAAPSLNTGEYTVNFFATDIQGNMNNKEVFKFFYNDSLIQGCTNLDIADKTYYLNTSLQSAGDCFEVSADNIILDGSEKVLSGTGSYGIKILKDDVRTFTLRNLDITGFGNTIASISSTPGADGTDINLINSNVEEILSHGEMGNAGHGGDVFLLDSSATFIDVHGADAFSFETSPGDAGNIHVKGEIIDFSSTSINVAPGFNNLGYGEAGYLILNYSSSYTDSLATDYGDKFKLIMSTKLNNGAKIEWEDELVPDFIAFRNLGSNSDLRNNYASINPTGGLSILDSPATISLFNMPGNFIDPEIKRDSLPCTECQALTSLNAETVMFTVPGFSVYSIGEKSIGNQAPTIVDIIDVSNQDIIPASSKTVSFNVIASDPNGWQDIFAVEFLATPPTDNIEKFNPNCEFIRSLSSLEAEYRCDINILYYDEPGIWTIRAVAIDQSFLRSSPRTENFVLNGMFYIAHPGRLVWPNLIPGNQNILANKRMVLNNSGNLDITELQIAGADLYGQLQSEFLIPSEVFSVNLVEQCEGFSLIGEQEVIIPGANIPRGDNSLKLGTGDSGQETLWYCAEEVPIGLPPQIYSTAEGPGIPWEIIFSLVLGFVELFALPISVRNRALKVLNELSTEEILDLLKERLKDDKIYIPVSIFREELSPAEALCKYLKENKGLKFSEISKLIGRDQRTIWNNYNNANKKIKFKEGGKKVPVDIFSENLSVLEALVSYLKDKGYKNFEIAELLGKDAKNVWTILSRAKSKRI